MSKWVFILYGADTKPATGEPSIPTAAAVAALTGVKTYNLDALGLFPELLFEADKITYLGNYKRASKSIGISFRIPALPVDFPTAKVAGVTPTIEALLPMDVLNKRYNWVRVSNDYFLTLDYLKDKNNYDYCIEVVVTGVSVTTDSNLKFVTLEMEYAR
jgi:hypothetical protein